jgi:YVTN family beta-propeller protein
MCAMLPLFLQVQLIMQQRAVLGTLLLPRRSAIRNRWSSSAPAARLATLAAVAGLILILAAGAAPVPAAAARPAAPKAYVGVFNDNTVTVIDTWTNHVVATIPIPTGPHGLVMSPDGLRVYASSDGASTVSVISTVTDRVVSTIDVGKSPHGLAISPDGRQVLVAVFGGSQVAVIDTVRNEVVARIPVGNPHNIAISPDGRTAYVASQRPGAAALAILDLAARRQTAAVPLDKTPRALNFSPDGAALYFTLAGSDAVQVLDPQRNQIVAQIPVGASPHHPLFTASGKYGLVVSQGPGQLALINPAGRQIVGTITVGSFPHWIATSSDGSTAYVTNEGANSISVVDIEKQRVLATIPVGNAPRKIVVQPGPVGKTAAVMPMHTIPVFAASVVSVMPLAAAGGAAVQVRIENFAFVSASVKVAPGTTVVWTNADQIPHTSTSKDGTWDSKPIQPSASFKVTFDKPGTYVYGCAIHPFMQATVVVGN